MPKDLTPRKIFYMLLRHIKLIFLITALVTLIAYGYSSFFITPVYSASSLILVQSYNEDVTPKSTKYYQATQPGRVAVSDIQQSASLASSCVILFENMPEMTALMSGASVTFEQIEESNFIKINANSSNPQVAANVANQLADQAPKCFADMYGKGNGKVNKIKGATPPSAPSSPNVNQNTLYGLAIGLVLGVLLAFMLEIIDTTLKPGDDLTKMYNIPVFAEIVDFEKAG
ncbi:MAG: hypothetical protein IJ903_04090 [Ruminococcus sp.]|nr:hypothetical protein [Ruminococcus sp.]